VLLGKLNFCFATTKNNPAHLAVDPATSTMLAWYDTAW